MKIFATPLNRKLITSNGLLLISALMIFFCTTLVVNAQSAEVKTIIEKAQSGKQLTDDEVQKLQRWGEEMMKNAGKQSSLTTDRSTASKKEPTGSQKGGSTQDTQCPPKQKLTATPPLTRDGYLKLAKELMVTYGQQSGQEAALRELLDAAGKPTDGADIGGMLMVTGAGSASIYAIAWSAVQ